MKFFKLSVIASLFILFTLGACSARHHDRKMECPMKEHGGQAMQKMADTCANQLASINTTKEILAAASGSKTTAQAKAAIAKASDELTRSADLISVCCSHIKMMGEGCRKCGMHKEGCRCAHGMTGDKPCGCPMER